MNTLQRTPANEIEYTTDVALFHRESLSGWHHSRLMGRGLSATCRRGYPPFRNAWIRSCQMARGRRVLFHTKRTVINNHRHTCSACAIRVSIRLSRPACCSATSFRSLIASSYSCRVEHGIAAHQSSRHQDMHTSQRSRQQNRDGPQQTK